jgi:hypothetical protein
MTTSVSVAQLAAINDAAMLYSLHRYSVATGPFLILWLHASQSRIHAGKSRTAETIYIKHSLLLKGSAVS